jgi:soluble lytic murein transglycosylase-like protein
MEENAMKALRILLLLIVWSLVPVQADNHVRQVESPKQKQERLFRFIATRSKHYGFKLSMVHRLIQIESRWNPNAESHEGAVGLTQVLVPTARIVMKDSRITKKDLKDPFGNVEIGLRYLAKLRRIFHGDLELALLSYNRGIKFVLEDIEAGRDPSNGYAMNVMGRQ